MENLFSVLATLTLFGSVIWFWISVALFLTICFASDINKNGFYAFGTLVVFVILFNFWGNIEPIVSFLTVKNIFIYLGIGFLVATLRTFVATKKLKKEIKDLPIEKPNQYPYTTKQEAKNEFIKELEGNVSRWWFMWPISSISFLVNDGWKFAYSKIKGYFKFIVELGLK